MKNRFNEEHSSPRYWLSVPWKLRWQHTTSVTSRVGLSPTPQETPVTTRAAKRLKGEFGELPIEIPHDRHGSFEPQLIPKHQTRWTGFDDKYCRCTPEV